MSLLKLLTLAFGFASLCCAAPCGVLACRAGRDWTVSAGRPHWDQSHHQMHHPCHTLKRRPSAHAAPQAMLQRSFDF
eukprot:6203886-Amphidinium_carterae.1